MTARTQPTHQHADAHEPLQTDESARVGGRETVTLEPLRLRKGIGRGVLLASVCHFRGTCRWKHLKTNSRTTLMTCTWSGTCNQKETLTIQEAARKYGQHKQ